MHEALEFILHIDQALEKGIDQYGPAIYAILFGIVFAETGLVVMPFLPGDSLLFAAGIYTHAGESGEAGRLNLWLVLGLLIVAAVLGDAVNYAVGKWVGPRVFTRQGSGTWIDKILNKKHLARANAFYAKYGGKAVVLGRFVPIVRTFVPFVAGAGAMDYRRFVWFNVSGAVLWVGVCVLAGHWFGQIEAVRKNFSIVALAIIAISLLPIVIELWMAKRQAKKAAASGVTTTNH